MTTYELVKTLDASRSQQVLQLYRSAGWWYPEDDEKPDLVKRILAGSHCFCIALKEDEIVGIGRAISDRVSDAFIQDIFVREDSRRQGIARGIVARLVEHLKKDGIEWIALIAAPGSAGVYELLGFKPMPGHIAVSLK